MWKGHCSDFFKLCFNKYSLLRPSPTYLKDKTELPVWEEMPDPLHLLPLWGFLYAPQNNLESSMKLSLSQSKTGFSLLSIGGNAMLLTVLSLVIKSSIQIALQLSNSVEWD